VIIRAEKDISLNYEGRKVLVLGLARSGISAMKLLADAGAVVTGADENPALEVPEDVDRSMIVLGEFDDSLLDSCSEIILSPGIPKEHGFVSKAVRRGIPVLGELELGYRFAEARLVAVTGTNGKSTTVNMIAHILDEAGMETVAAGNVGVPLTSVARKIGPHGIIVVEVSSFQLETISTFRAGVSGILNLTPDHLDRYDSLDEYYEAKARIVENAVEDDFLFYNAEDVRTLRIAKTFPGRTFPFSSSSVLDEGAYFDGERLVLSTEEGSEAFMSTDELKVVGIHNIENALAAVAAVHPFGISLDVCRKALATFKGLPHRMELVAEIDGVAYYNDSKATNVEAALMSLKGIDRPVVLIAGGKDKGGNFGKLLEAADRLKAVITIGEAASLIEEAIGNAIPTARADTMHDAVEKAAKTAERGDIVLLSPACASFDMFKNFEHRGEVFSSCVLNMRQ